MVSVQEHLAQKANRKLQTYNEMHHYTILYYQTLFKKTKQHFSVHAKFDSTTNS